MTKRKSQPKSVPEPHPEPPVLAVQPEVSDRAVPSAPRERSAAMVPCVVCGSETRADLPEQLCWVCRRLKISAWRDSEQMPAQE